MKVCCHCPSTKWFIFYPQIRIKNGNVSSVDISDGAADLKMDDDAASALDTLYSMFGAIDREVVRTMFVEQCGGDMDAAVNALTIVDQMNSEEADENDNDKEDEQSMNMLSLIWSHIQLGRPGSTKSQLTIGIRP